MWNARIATVREYGLTPIADGAIDRWFTPEFAAREPELIRTFRRTLLETPRDGYIAACIAIRDADQRTLVPDIARPTLIVAGQADHVTPVAAGAWLADTIPGARMVTLRAAHLANVEAAAEFNEAVSTFLASTEA
jgi:3-oxoadipate enol-lactonase